MSVGRQNKLFLKVFSLNPLQQDDLGLGHSFNPHGFDCVIGSFFTLKHSVLEKSQSDFHTFRKLCVGLHLFIVNLDSFGILGLFILFENLSEVYISLRSYKCL